MFDLATISRLESGNKGREFMYETGLTAQHIASTIILEKCSNAGVGKYSTDRKSDYQTSKIDISVESYVCGGTPKFQELLKNLFKLFVQV